MPRHTPAAVLLLLALVALSFLSIRLWFPPAAVPATAPATEFSAERAMAHVRQVAREPHAMGTAAHAQAREYLLKELQKLGLQTKVQEATAVEMRNGAAYAGYVYNVLGRLKGRRGSGKALLLVAHYDSQPNAGGAGDDAAGVAAILETVRALQQEQALQNDLMVLFTDGEEYGLYGARAFLQHPWAQEVGLVLNLEARGNSGASNTFEISAENGLLMQEFAKVAPYPLAGSLMYEVYRLMPNDTDFSVFRRAGYPGFNSAFIDGFVHYHKLTDSPANLNPNSLQHHGSNLLALARHFGNRPLQNLKAPDRVFFNLAGYQMVQYPKPLNWLLLVLTGVLLVAVAALVLHRKAATARQLLLGFLGFLFAVALVAGLVFLLNKLAILLMPHFHPQNGVYHSELFFLAYLLVALGLFLLLVYLYRRLPLWGLLTGVYLLWFMLGLGAQLVVPAGSYICLVPLFFCLLGALLVLLRQALRQHLLYFGVVMLAAALPAVFMLMPVVRMLFVVFALKLPVAMAGLLLLVAGLLLPVLSPAEKVLRRNNWPVLPFLVLLAGLGLSFLATWLEKPSPQQPQHSHLSYYLNTDTNRAWWASDFLSADSWNSQFFTPNAKKGPLKDMYPQALREVLHHAAQPLDLPPPVAYVEHAATANGLRTLGLLLHSERQAQHLEVVLLAEEGIAISNISLNEVPCPVQPQPTKEGMAYYLKLNGLPLQKEAHLLLQHPAAAKVRVLLYDQSIGLPQQLIKQPRPAHVVPEQGQTSNLTVVRKTYQF